MEINISKKSVTAVKNQLSDLSLAEQKAWIPVLRADERKGIQALAEQIERRVQRAAMEEERLAHMWQIGMAVSPAPMRPVGAPWQGRLWRRR